ncbi:thiamine pyrophosphate-binding protein [bacterium]|nr:thiamine pyrophosphate-binding protein [candidate division CSSED10-310 bacterium]
MGDAYPSHHTTARERSARARAIEAAGGILESITAGSLPPVIDCTLSEAIVLGLLRQGVTRFLAVFGHGSTELAEVLRIYQEAGVLRTCNVRNEIEASHAAAALRWITGEKAAVVTSIGPGALQAMAASLVPASNGLGVWYLFGDETTEDEGPNMQQIPSPAQAQYLKLCSVMGGAYSLHTPGALNTALRRGMNTVDHPHRAGPFFLLMPMNTQPALLRSFNLAELPSGEVPAMGAAAGEEGYAAAVGVLRRARRIVVKAGGGARHAGPQLERFLDLVDGVAVISPMASGVLPYGHPRNMLVGGSKGTICGNHAMEQADVLVALGSRFVCQSDSSRTGYLNLTNTITINTDLDATLHYNNTIGLWGECGATLDELNLRLEAAGMRNEPGESAWFRSCADKRAEWEAFKKLRFDRPSLHDDALNRNVLTQPAAVKIASDWARRHDLITFFDAGDVQANGFQVVEDDRPGRTFTDTGASYMGFAVSALLATALTEKPIFGLAVTGDGSFTMNPQILIDGVVHGARGCILLLDNRRMAAISALQQAQYGHEYATADNLRIDYVRWAGAIPGLLALHGGTTPDELLTALDRARVYQGLSLVYAPVYYGPDPLGGLGAFGRWNVGNWVMETQALRHRLGL